MCEDGAVLFTNHYKCMQYNTDSTDSPHCLPLLLSIHVIIIIIIIFFLFHFFSRPVRWIKLTHVSFSAYVEIAHRISYRTGK